MTVPTAKKILSRTQTAWGRSSNAPRTIKFHIRSKNHAPKFPSKPVLAAMGVLFGMLLAFPITAFAKITPLPKPHNLAPARWVVVGPFANPYDRIRAKKSCWKTCQRGRRPLRLTLHGRQRASLRSCLITYGADFNTAFGGGPFSNDGGLRLLRSPRQTRATCSPASVPTMAPGCGSTGRDPPSRRFTSSRSEPDHFNAHQKGVNRFVVKVESGSGGWGFALRLMDAEGQTAAKRRALRANLFDRDLGPEEGGFLLTNRFPNIVCRADAALGDRARSLKVRWFGPTCRNLPRPRPTAAISPVERETTTVTSTSAF